MHRFRKLFAAVVIACLFAAAAGADEMRILVPYAGVLSNTTDIPSMSLELEDTGFLTGLFFQWIDTERYQWNAFLYWAPEVNYSSTVGGHFIFDLNFGPDWYGRFVAGLGLEALMVDLDAGDALGTDDLEMSTTVFIPYLRVGKYFKESFGPADLSVLAWAGIQPQWTWGEVVVDPPAPTPPAVISRSSLDDSALYGIAGINLRATFFHFVDLEGKYQGTFKEEEYYSTVSAMANVYLSRSWGLSYRFKYLESSEGANAFHYFGIAYIF